MGIDLVVIGGGRMGEALVAGLLARAWASPEALAVAEVDPARRRLLESAHPGVTVVAAPPPADAAILAVKPADVPAACSELHHAPPQRVLSVAAGVRLASLGSWLPPETVVLRAMPNTPALVGEAASALAAEPGVGDDDLAWATGVLEAVGTVVRVSEHLLDAVTGLSGSGPAYVFLVAEALIDGGVLAGLPRPTARALVVQTLLGAARMLAETGETPEVLRAAVTSPGGTTAAGLRALESAAARAAFIDAVVAARDRAAELGG
jgi:pyrroline-5-carboxylate reductase